MKAHLGVEVLESKQLMAAGVTVSLAGGLLAIVGTNQNDNIRVSNPDANTVQVNIQGAPAPLTFAASAVTQLAIDGGNGDDSLVNLTNINSQISGDNGDDYIQSGLTLGVGGNDTLTGGNGDDIINDTGGTNTIIGGNGNDNLWGFGTDVIYGNNGNDTIYNIVGSGQVVGGNGNDRVIINQNFTNIADSADRPAVVFGIARADIALDNGVLYFAGTNGNNNVGTVTDNGDGTITATLNDANGTFSQVFNKADVDQVATIQGNGNDTFINDTSIDTVAYGSGGNDFLQGGSGNDLLKGGAGNDILVGNGGADDFTGDGGNDILNAGRGRNIIRAGFDNMDKVIVTGNNTIVIGDPLSIVGSTPSKRYGPLIP